jgi:hypothetical protein
MNQVKHSTKANVDDKAKKIAIICDLASNEIEILGKEKQEIVKKIKKERDQQRVEKLKEELGLKEKSNE